MTVPAPATRISNAEWLERPATRQVFAALAAAGHEARAVGGAVRNTLLGEPVSDVDLATPALPEAVMAAARAAGLKAVPTGIAHGTVTVVSRHIGYEVTTLRRDVATDGRRAVVAFTADWTEDARRRDFTMNALYCSADGTLHDPVGGLADLAARCVRFIGAPADRIREDYLRILRFFRFHATYGQGLAPDAAAVMACVRARQGLASLSAERIASELLRLLVAPHAAAGLRVMLEYGLIGWVLPAVPRLTAFARLADIERTLGRNPDPMLRLGVLGSHAGEDADRLGERLRLSTTERRHLLELVACDPAPDCDWPERDGRRLLYQVGVDAYARAVLLHWALAREAPEDQRWRHLLALPQRWQPQRFPIAGHDLSMLGAQPGPGMGLLLRQIEAEWIAGDFTMDRDQLLARARELCTAA